MSETPDLVDVARSHSVGVIGGGIGGLIVAWECAKVGMTVTLWDAGDVGGMTRVASVGGAFVDVAADTIERNDAVEEVLAAFDLTDQLVPVADTRRWLLGRTPVPLPESPALGIPANPFATEVTGIIGWGAVWRAYLDRLKPVLTIGNTETLGELVSKRMGAKVCDRLVAPRTRAELRLEPNDVLVDLALPELNGALTRAGSLSGGVGLLEAAAPPLGLAGGLGGLAAALRARIAELGGTVHEHAPVTSIQPSDGGWNIVATSSDADADESTETSVQHLVLATDERSARALLVPHLPALPADATTGQTVVTLTVTGVTTARGAGLYATDATDATSAVQRIDHVSAQQPAIARPAGHEIFRVTLAGHDADDATATEQALAAIAEGYGDAASVVGSHVQRFARAHMRAARGQAERVAKIRAQMAALAQIDAVGAWVAGDGVAEVIEDAMITAEAIRRRALFSA